MKIDARFQFRVFFNCPPQILVGRSRIGGRFQNHQRPFLQMRRDLASGFNDKRDVGFTIFVQRCRHANDHCLGFFDLAEVR